MQTLIGTMWKLIEASSFNEEGHELTPPLGQHPMGIAMFEAERMIVAVADDRSITAYCGRYTFDGTTLVTSVDSASSPDLAGQQIRQIRFDSPTSMMVTPKNKLLGRDAGLRFLWERIG